MRKIAAIFIALVAFAIWTPYVAAFESYNDPDVDMNGYCSSTQCHPGFVGGPGNVTHDLHTGGDREITDNCELCHSDTESDNPNPLTLWSSYDDDNGYGCVGCHGRFDNDSIGRNYNDFPIAGKPKASGAGLRMLHEKKGVPSCFGCHGEIDPLPENISPPYYNDSRAGVYFTDSCSDGLDNDGDGLYDNVDPDCGAVLKAATEF